MAGLGRKGHKFSDDGIFVGEVEHTITPPDKLEALAKEHNSNGAFPNLEMLLSVPMDQIVALVKSKAETNVLCQIRQLSSRLSSLIRFLTEELQSAEIIEEAWKKTNNDTISELSYLTPVVGNQVQSHFKNVNLLMEKIAKCLSELAYQKRSLMQYQEINASLSEELLNEGCKQLAEDKKTLSKLEELLLKRLDSLFYEGPPYRSFATSWKDIHTETKSIEQDTETPNTPPTPLHNELNSSDLRNITKVQSLVKYKYTTQVHDSDDELSTRTKELVKSTQEKLFSFESSWHTSSGSSSEGNYSTPTTPRHYSSSNKRPHPPDSNEDREWKKIKSLSTSPGGSHSDGSFFLYSPKPVPLRSICNKDGD